MSNNRELALTVALEAVINAARSLHVDVEELCETAIESLLVVPSRVSPVVVEAIRQIEVAADALDYGESASGRCSSSEAR